MEIDSFKLSWNKSFKRVCIDLSLIENSSLFCYHHALVEKRSRFMMEIELTHT